MSDNEFMCKRCVKLTDGFSFTAHIKKFSLFHI